MFKLEDRILLDAAAASDAADAQDQAEDAEQQDSTVDNSDSESDSQNSETASEKSAEIPEYVEDELEAILAAENQANPDAVSGQGIRLLIISDSINQADINFSSADENVIVIKFSPKAVDCKTLLAEINDALNGRQIDTLNLITGEVDSESLLLVDQFFWEELADNMSEDASIELASEEVNTSTALEIEDITGRDVELIDTYMGSLILENTNRSGDITAVADFENAPDISVYPTELQAINLDDPTNINLPPIEAFSNFGEFEITDAAQPEGEALFGTSSITFDGNSPNSGASCTCNNDPYNDVSFGFTDQAIQGGLNYYLMHPLQEFRYNAYLDQAELQALQIRVEASNDEALSVFFPNVPHDTEFLSTPPPYDGNVVDIDKPGSDILEDSVDEYYDDDFNQLNSRNTAMKSSLDKTLDSLFDPDDDLSDK
ncbi:MAG: hypothetical protein GY750_18300 [Lentisphaerae bacterium]|nr:hypothetical protein [Lentisphaerota bacterium]MCP4103349.1 hypothetical protein [Lentisphaerota bacterium]